MQIRIATIALTVLCSVAPWLHAGDKTADIPAVVVRIKSLNALLENLNLVVKLVGQDDAALAIEGVIKSKIGKMGLQGVDPARPFGGYVRFGKSIDDVNGAILIPISDQKTFLKLLEDQNLEVAKGKDDIYTYKTNKNIDVYFRFAQQYLFITSVNTESIKGKNLVDPAKALTITGDATISVAARLDRIPNDVKLIVLEHLKETMVAAKKNAPLAESKVQEAFRVALLDDVQRLGAALIRDAGEVRFDLDVSEKTKEMTVNLSVAAMPNSDLAKSIKSLGDLKSPLAALATKDAAFHGAVHFSLPAALNQALSDVVDETAQKSLEGIQDPLKKKQADTLFKALLPSAKSGEFQAVAVALGPKDKHYTFVGAVKLKDALKLGSTVHDLIQDALKTIPEDQRGKIQLDFDKAGAIAIHRFEIPKNPALDKLTGEVAGDKYLYLAFRDDALFVALGKEALPSLKNALAQKEAVASLPLVFDFDVARMAPLMAQTDEHKALAAKLFPAGQSGRVRLSIEGGSSLSARLQMQLNVLEFLMKVTQKPQ
jgi:hypothetical protein